MFFFTGGRGTFESKVALRPQKTIPYGGPRLLSLDSALTIVMLRDVEGSKLEEMAQGPVLKPMPDACLPWCRSQLLTAP